MLSGAERYRALAMPERDRSRLRTTSAAVVYCCVLPKSRTAASACIKESGPPHIVPCPPYIGGASSEKSAAPNMMAGSNMNLRSRRRICRLRCTPGLFHIVAFMAGASTTGASLAVMHSDRRSEHEAWATRLSAFADAGRTAMTSADRASVTCGTRIPSFCSNPSSQQRMP